MFDTNKSDCKTRIKNVMYKSSLYDLNSKNNKGNAKRGVSPRLQIWKSIGFQTLLRTKHVPSLVKIHWRILILECSQGCYVVKIWPSDLDLWPWKSIGFQTLLRTKYVPSLVKIHWRMLILECSQGCYTVNIWPGDLDLWPWKSIGFQTLQRTKYVPSLVKIHWRMLILECSQGCYVRTDGRKDGRKERQ
jgi:hypothetical protein